MYAARLLWRHASRFGADARDTAATTPFFDFTTATAIAGSTGATGLAGGKIDILSGAADGGACLASDTTVHASSITSSAGVSARSSTRSSARASDGASAIATTSSARVRRPRSGSVRGLRGSPGAVLLR
jgi:hypothetical protein